MPAGRKRLGEPGKVKSLLEAVQKYKNFKQMAQFNVVSLKARTNHRICVGHRGFVAHRGPLYPRAIAGPQQPRIDDGHRSVAPIAVHGARERR